MFVEYAGLPRRSVRRPAFGLNRCEECVLQSRDGFAVATTTELDYRGDDVIVGAGGEGRFKQT